MPLLGKKKTPEELEAERVEKERRQAEADERARQERIARARDAFFASPVGRARRAFANGDHVFQYSLDVRSQKAIVVALTSATTSAKNVDPTDVLNAVSREGWDIVSASFVFVEEGMQSRDKMLSSGQQVAVKGSVVGYYVFRRAEANRADPLSKPWEAID